MKILIFRISWSRARIYTHVAFLILFRSRTDFKFVKNVLQGHEFRLEAPPPSAEEREKNFNRFSIILKNASMIIFYIFLHVFERFVACRDRHKCFIFVCVLQRIYNVFGTIQFLQRSKSEKSTFLFGWKNPCPSQGVQCQLFSKKIFFIFFLKCFEMLKFCKDRFILTHWRWKFHIFSKKKKINFFKKFQKNSIFFVGSMTTGETWEFQISQKIFGPPEEFWVCKIGQDTPPPSPEERSSQIWNRYGSLNGFFFFWLRQNFLKRRRSIVFGRFKAIQSF